MLVHEFTRASSILEAAEDAVGENALLDELRTFVAEWRHKRQLLIESIDAVYTMATKSREGYVRADDHLAHSIEGVVQGAGR
jgi:hypothetical protein